MLNNMAATPCYTLGGACCANNALEAEQARAKPILRLSTYNDNDAQGRKPGFADYSTRR